MKTVIKVTCATALLISFSGCGFSNQLSPKVRSVTVDVPLSKISIKDNSVLSPALRNAKFRRVIVVAPNGSSRGAFDESTNQIEGAFLRSGLNVISSAITARVGKESEGGSNTTKGEGTGLSDAEKALILAKSSGAEVMLQVGNWDWMKVVSLQEKRVRVSQGFQSFMKTVEESSVDPKTLQRYFISDAGSDSGTMSETIKSEWDKTEAFKIAIGSDVLHFSGRLIDIKTGEVMGTLEMWSSPLVSLPDHTRFSINMRGTEVSVEATNLQESEWDSMVVSHSEILLWPADNDWNKWARGQAVGRVLNQIAGIILGKRS
jgi:hypothetical protein